MKKIKYNIEKDKKLDELLTNLSEKKEAFIPTKELNQKIFENLKLQMKRTLFKDKIKYNIKDRLIIFFGWERGFKFSYQFLLFSMIIISEIFLLFFVIKNSHTQTFQTKNQLENLKNKGLVTQENKDSNIEKFSGNRSIIVDEVLKSRENGVDKKIDTMQIQFGNRFGFVVGNKNIFSEIENYLQKNKIDYKKEKNKLFTDWYFDVSDNKLLQVRCLFIFDTISVNKLIVVFEEKKSSKFKLNFIEEMKEMVVNLSEKK